MSDLPQRIPEPEPMNDAEEAQAYATADFSDVNQAFVDCLLTFVGPLEQADALDMGTGPGDIPLRVLRERGGWRITGVDVSEAMLDIARAAAEQAGAGGSLTFIQADAKGTPLPDASFDVIFSNSILHHVTETGRFWSEIARLARPGATVFLRDLARPAGADLARRIVQQYAGEESGLLQEEYYRSLLSAYTPEEVRSQLDAAGLTSLTVEKITDRHLDIFGHVDGCRGWS